MAGIFTKIVEGVASTVLDNLRDKLLNPAISQFGTVTRIDYRDGKLLLTCELAGLEGNDIDVTVGKILIADDASYIELGDFDSNRKFAKNLLNCFAAKKHDVPDKPAVRKALLSAKKYLHL